MKVKEKKKGDYWSHKNSEDLGYHLLSCDGARGREDILMRLDVRWMS